jgi:hypothetical protein
MVVGIATGLIAAIAFGHALVSVSVRDREDLLASL